MPFSTDKPNPIIIHGNSTAELPKTQVSDKSATANNFISISLKILSFTVAMLIFANIFVSIYDSFVQQTAISKETVLQNNHQII